KSIEDGRKVYPIYSVKRLSDGEIFTIGDDCITRTKHYGKIKLFEICNDKLYIKSDQNISSAYTCNINDLKPIKKPLFTTEDGVDVFENDVYYRVLPISYSITSLRCKNKFNNSYAGAKFFST